MPISIVDLGIVADITVAEAGPGGRDGARVAVEITPTFVGCPALDMLRREIETRVAGLAGVADVRVTFVNSPVWTVERITEAGRQALRAHGIVVPERGALSRGPGPVLVGLGVQAGHSTQPEPGARCPFCNSDATELESAFGPTRCRMIYYCTSCRNSFERLKPI